MSYFANLFRGTVANTHASFFARPVTVAIPGSAAFSTPAVTQNSRILTRPGDGGTVTVAIMPCRFTELESIRHDAIVTVDAFEWAIEETITSDTPGTSVSLIRTLRNEASRDNYRR